MIYTVIGMAVCKVMRRVFDMAYHNIRIPITCSGAIRVVTPIGITGKTSVDSVSTSVFTKIPISPPCTNITAGAIASANRITGYIAPAPRHVTLVADVFTILTANRIANPTHMKIIAIFVAAKITPAIHTAGALHSRRALTLCKSNTTAIWSTVTPTITHAKNTIQLTYTMAASVVQPSISAPAFIDRKTGKPTDAKKRRSLAKV
jgi:hypothetical protein